MELLASSSNIKTSDIDLNKILPISASIENATYYLSDKSHDVLVGNSNSSSCSGSSSGGKSAAICKSGM